MRIGLMRYKNRGFNCESIRANRFARIALQIARATKPSAKTLVNWSGSAFALPCFSPQSEVAGARAAVVVLSEHSLHCLQQLQVILAAATGDQRLRKTRPPTRVFGPFGPEVPPEVPKRVSPKSGVCLGVSEGVLQGSFEPRPKMCPKSDLKVSKKTLFGHF